MDKHISADWLFVPGDRTDAENGIPFHLDSSGSIDFDRLRENPFQAEEDGTAYNRFHLDRDMELGFGMGCDWWAEVRLNGQVLYTTFPDEPEGSLAQRFVVLVCKETVAEVVRALDIKGYIQAINTNVNDKDSVLCDVGEALIAAIYKDSGSLDVTQDFIKRCWQPYIDKKSQPKKDYKTLLQEQAAVLKYPAPVYKVISKTGPEHAPMFVMEVSLNNHLKALGKGSSKKQAEQAAAALMLDTLGVKDA